MDIVNIYIDVKNAFMPVNWEIEAVKKIVDKIVKEARSHGTIGEIRAYIDSKVLSDPMRKLFIAKGLQIIDTVPLNNHGKGSDDQAMFLAIAQLPFLQPNVKAAVVVAGDGDYTLAVATLSLHGVETILMSTNGTSFTLEKAANGCTYIDIDEDLNGTKKGNGKQKEEDECDDNVLLQRIKDRIDENDGDLDRRMLIAEMVQRVDDPAAIGYMAHRIAELFRKGIIEHYFIRENGSQNQRIRLSREAMEELR